MKTLTQAEYQKAFAATDADKTPFQRHLEVCGIKTKMDLKRRATKFLWGVKESTYNGIVTTWTPLTSLDKYHLSEIKDFLNRIPSNGSDNESIGYVIDLIDVARA